MRWRNASLTLVATAAVCLSSTAQAAHWNVGVYMGMPSPYYYPYPAMPVVPAPYYYVPPAPVVVAPPPEPDVYIERSQVAPAAQAPSSSGGTWWYCARSKTYYPYVKECASGWQEVPANPPAPRR